MPIFLWSMVVNQLQKPVVDWGRRRGSGRATVFGRERVTVVIGALLTALGGGCGWSLLLQQEVGDLVRLLWGHRLQARRRVVDERGHAHADALAWWEATALRRHRDHRRGVADPAGEVLLGQRVRTAGEDGAAGEVGEVRAVGRLRGVVEDVAVGALERLDDQLLGRAGRCGAVGFVERVHRSLLLLGDPLL